MRTIIRLQNKFPANTKLHKIVIQGNRTHLSGRYIEHLGWWRPTKDRNNPRSIVLNKNRLRYWIGTGAVFGDRIQRFFQFGDMMPSPWVKFGNKTVYKSERETVSRWKKGLNKFYENAFHDNNEEMYEFKKEKEIEAMFFRRIKFRRGLESYLDKEMQVEEIVNESRGVSKSDDILTRSEKFNSLKKIYDSIENEGLKMSDYKKQMIYTKMNELTEDGIVKDEDIKGEFVYQGKKLNFKDLEKLFERKYVERKEKTKKHLTELNKLMDTISESDFIKEVEQQTKLDFLEIEKEVKKVFQEKQKNNLNVHHFDLINFINIYKGLYPGKNEEFDEISQEIQSKRVFHSKNPTTPIPDLNQYDPEDWFDLREDSVFPIKPVTKDNLEWFETPLTDAREHARDNANVRKKEDRVKKILRERFGENFKFKSNEFYQFIADANNIEDVAK